MLAKIAFYSILGKPVLMWIGVLTLLAFLAAAAIAVLGMKGKLGAFNHFTWHIRLARLGIGLAVLHGILAASAYLN